MRQKSKTREYIESLLIAALIALFVRSFIVQAFKIPSSSMEPTLLIGDHLLVNRLSYVTKVPFTDIGSSQPRQPCKRRRNCFPLSRRQEQGFHKKGHRDRGRRNPDKGKGNLHQRKEDGATHMPFSPKRRSFPVLSPSATTSDRSRSQRTLISSWATTGTGVSTAGSGDL